MEEQETEIIELEMNNEDIDEIIENLKELKENKSHVNLDVADDLSLLVHYLKE